MRQGSNPRRSRGRGPRKPHNPSRPQNFDGGNAEGRVRGNAYQVMEKYLAMARDASAAGDRIAMENYLQHAEHYYRMLNANGEANRGRPARADANGGGGQGNGVDGQQDDDAQPGNSLQSGPSGQGGLRTGAMAEPSEDSEA
jgi:hypothetical protein